jgi:hypothetical protein
MNIARDVDQRRRFAPSRLAELADLANHCAAIHLYCACRADPLQPGSERVAREPARRVKLARDIADGFLDVTANHHLPVTGMFDQLCDVL